MEQREGGGSPDEPEIDVITDHYETYISTINYCETSEATHLTLFDAGAKLRQSGEYNIGGTYSDGEPELWFYFTTSYCHGVNYLLNLFFCQRKAGSYAIQVSDSNEVLNKPMNDENITHLMLPKVFSRTYTFKSVKPDQHHYIKTFCIDRDMSKYGPVCTLVIPIIITVNPVSLLNENIMKYIKLQHDLSGLLTKQEKTDFVLESVTHKQFPTHKILLAAHSPVLRDMIKNAKLKSLFIDISDNDVELLIEFIYTGTIKNIMQHHCSKLLEIADKFQLKALFLLTQYVVRGQINVDNAVEMAIVAKKYNLEELQNKVFDFIIKNPEVMKTEAWLNLKDVELTKFLFQYMHSIKD